MSSTTIFLILIMAFTGTSCVLLGFLCKFAEEIREKLFDDLQDGAERKEEDK